MKSPKFVGDGVRWWSGRAGSWVKPICWCRQFFQRNYISWRHFFVISTHLPRNNQRDVSGEEGGLEVTQLGTGFLFNRFCQFCQLSPLFWSGISLQSCLLHFPHCVRWSLPIGKQVWPTLRDPSSTSRWSSSSQSSMRSSPSRWSRFQNVNYPQDVFQVKLDRRPSSWSWLKQPKLPTRFFRHHHWHEEDCHFPLTPQHGHLFHPNFDQDSCYYNFSCLRPVGDLLPFNNVFSNITYVAAGLKPTTLVNPQHMRCKIVFFILLKIELLVALPSFWDKTPNLTRFYRRLSLPTLKLRVSTTHWHICQGRQVIVLIPRPSFPDQCLCEESEKAEGPWGVSAFSQQPWVRKSTFQKDW